MMPGASMMPGVAMMTEGWSIGFAFAAIPFGARQRKRENDKIIMVNILW
jgi:hypothetical protein